jgi:hypothetical protein
MDKAALNSGMSFFNLAAWYSLVTPFATIAAYLILCLIAAHSHRDDNFGINFMFCLIWVQFSSFIGGIVSLFGVKQHGVKIILWKSVIGILASCGVGFLAFIMWVNFMM